MPYETPLISTVVIALVLAFLLGAVAARFRLPPLIGYLIAGIAVGPHTPGFIADVELAAQLAEIGVILLMFGVGLHFSLKDLLSVRAVAIPGALGQIAGATMLGMVLAGFMGWDLGAGLMFGLALSVASTVVLVKALQDRNLVESERGRIAVGWLIVEDLAMVVTLVLVPALAGMLGGEDNARSSDAVVGFVERLMGADIGVLGVLGITLAKFGAFLAFILIVGRRLIPELLHRTAHAGSRELFRLAVLAIALGVAAGSAFLFGVSLALGAFFAGMILSESELSQNAAEETLPLRDAFAVLFFVSVGMLFDPSILVNNPLPVVATILIILVGKSMLAFFIVLAFRMPVATAIAVAVSLAQVGEFSFILAELGVGLEILPEEGRDLILAGALVTIILNPLAFWAAERFTPALERRFRSKQVATGRAASPDPVALSGHTVLIGFGRVGSVVAERLAKNGDSVVVIEDTDDRVAAARAAGHAVIVGNGAAPASHEKANVATARQMVIAVPNSFEAGQAVEQARRANPDILIIARAHSDEAAEHLRNLGADHAIMGEREIGLGMAAYLSRDAGA
jgi:CPA2 family monovalent cation:H+ antiporter-2